MRTIEVATVNRLGEARPHPAQQSTDSHSQLYSCTRTTRARPYEVRIFPARCRPKELSRVRRRAVAGHEPKGCSREYI